MPRISRLRRLTLLATGLVSANLAAQDGGFRTSLELTGTWDSNFSRSPLEDEELITRAALDVGYSNSFGKQSMSTALRFTQYDYRHNDDLDAQVGTGVFDWQGQVGSKLLFDLGARREAAPVDRLEFTGKDIVTRDDFTGRVGYGSRSKLGIFVGGRDTRQTRSASERRFLNFDEQEVFLQAELATTDGNWLHALSVHDGDRQFEGTLDAIPGDLDFDYRQYAYDVQWRVSDKSQLNFGVARFERSGNLNDNSGAVLNGSWDWEVTPKVGLQLGYVLSRPAVGEDVNARVKAASTSITTSWQVADQWRLEASALYADETYRLPNVAGDTQETFMRWRPLAIVFSREELLSIRLDAEITERNSSVLLRDYDGVLANLSFKLSF